jgi:hypothetical protein
MYRWVITYGTVQKKKRRDSGKKNHVLMNTKNLFEPPPHNHGLHRLIHKFCL